MGEGRGEEEEGEKESEREKRRGCVPPDTQPDGSTPVRLPPTETPVRWAGVLYPLQDGSLQVQVRQHVCYWQLLGHEIGLLSQYV